MGSLISSKMAAPAARVIQAVRPHAPLIKFPDRHAIPRPNGESVHKYSSQEVLKALALNLPQANRSPSASAPPQLSTPHRPLTPIPGVPDSLASIQQMPARYRRRPLTFEEMDYIQRGGPE